MPQGRKRSPIEVVSDEPKPQTATVTIGDDGSLTVETSRTDDDAADDTGAGDDTSFDRNLADDLGKDALDAIAGWLLDGVEADKESRREWEDTANIASLYLGVKLEDPTTSVSADGTVTKVIATCMLEALTKLWSVARAELLPVSGPVKVRNDQTALDTKSLMPEPPGIAAPGPAPQASPQPGAAPAPQSGGIAAAVPEKPPTYDELAQALESDLNHYLTVRDREYYPDFSKMLSNRALIGNAFRKVYRCPLRRRPVSVWVKAQDLIVSNDCSHLQGAGRITEVVKIRQSTMRRLMVAGAYRDITLVQPTGRTTPTEEAVAQQEGITATPQLPGDFEHMVYEIRSEIGSSASNTFIGDLGKLDRDENGKKLGYPLPYRVSIDVDSREILEIRRNWKKGDPDHNPKRTYVKYGFIPGTGFYDWGLIHLVGNPTQAATMIQRAGVDASLFANFPGGMFLKSPASRQASTVIRPNPGEFQGVDGGGASKIQDVFMPMPYKEPSAQSMALIQKFEGDVRRLAGTIDIPVGEGRIGNTPVGTVMSYIEAVTQVPSAVHKDDHIAQQEEYELLRQLFADEPDQLVAGNKTPKRKKWLAEEILIPDLVPTADPNTPSQIHRLMKVQAKVTLGGMPQFQGIADQRAIWQQAMQELGTDPASVTLPPQPPQAGQMPPQVIAAQIKAQSQKDSDAAKLEIAQTTAQAKKEETAEESQQRELDRESETQRAALEHGVSHIATLHDTANAAADRAQEDRHHAIDTVAAAQQAAQQPSPGGTPPSGQSPGFGGPTF